MKFYAGGCRDHRLAGKCADPDLLCYAVRNLESHDQAEPDDVIAELERLETELASVKAELEVFREGVRSAREKIGVDLVELAKVKVRGKYPGAFYDPVGRVIRFSPEGMPLSYPAGKDEGPDRKSVV